MIQPILFLKISDIISKRLEAAIFQFDDLSLLVCQMCFVMGYERQLVEVYQAIMLLIAWQ